MSLVMNLQPRNLQYIWQSFFTWTRGNHHGFGIFYTIIAAQIIILAAVAWQSAVPVERLFRDMIIVAEESPDCCHVYDGLISNLGILLWWVAASVTGFAALVAVSLSGRTYDILALAMAAVFSAWLALDDLFMLHDTVLPLFGIPQPATYALYGSIASAYIALSWRVVLMAAPLFLLMAISMLGLSVFIDILSDYDVGAISLWLQSNTQTKYLLEDGSKFLGIGFWCCLHMAAAKNVLENVATSRLQKEGQI